MRPTRFFTGALRWLVPSTVDAASLSASIWAGRMRAGPDPKRPSAGRSSSGIVIFVAVTLDILRRVGRGRTSARRMATGITRRVAAGRAAAADTVGGRGYDPEGNPPRTGYCQS